jgi:hypothetical protein
VARAGRSWTLRLFTDPQVALPAASAMGLAKKSLRGIRTLDELRGILMALTQAYPKLTRLAVDNRWAPIADVIVIRESA